MKSWFGGDWHDKKRVLIGLTRAGHRVGWLLGLCIWPQRSSCQSSRGSEESWLELILKPSIDQVLGGARHLSWLFFEKADATVVACLCEKPCGIKSFLCGFCFHDDVEVLWCMEQSADSFVLNSGSSNEQLLHSLKMQVLHNDLGSEVWFADWARVSALIFSRFRWHPTRWSNKSLLISFVVLRWPHFSHWRRRRLAVSSSPYIEVCLHSITNTRIDPHWEHFLRWTFSLLKHDAVIRPRADKESCERDDQDGAA
jgi:hypothetical protein